MRCIVGGSAVAGLAAAALASEAPLIVKLVAVCALVGSLLAWDFAFATLLDDSR